MKLYWSPRTRAFSALWLMEESGLSYERIRVDITDGAHKTPEFLAANPMGKVPTLVDGDAALGETAAICAYVAERAPQAELAPPLGDVGRARYLQWLTFAPACIEPAVMQAFVKFDVPASMAGWGSVQQTFDVLDGALAAGPWLLGDRFSAADIAVGSGLNFAVRQFGLVPTRPNFDRYLDACIARPAFQRALAISESATSS